MKKIKTALISVSDKKNLKPLLNTLKKNKIRMNANGPEIKPSFLELVYIFEL